MLNILAPKGTVTFRVIHSQDRDFLYALFADGLAFEMANLTWDQPSKDTFLKQQFNAREQSYQMSFPAAIYRIIQLDGVDIGNLIVHRQDECLRLIDLSIASGMQGRGIGSDIVRSLMKEAYDGRVPMRLAANKLGRAVAFYKRLGFRQIEDRTTHWELEWKPEIRTTEV